MKRLNIPLVADSILCSLAAFFVAFTLTRFYAKNSLVALVVGVLVAVAFFLLAYLYIRHKYKKALGITSNNLQVASLKNHLCLCPLKETKRLLGGIYVPTNEEQKTKIFYLFKFSALNLDDLLPVFQNSSPNKLVLANSLSEECKSALKSLDIPFKEIEEIYAFLVENSLLPEKLISLKAPHISFVERISSRFNRRLSLPLFLSGVSLVALSYFTFFPIYYIVVGAILLVLSVVAIIFK